MIRRVTIGMVAGAALLLLPATGSAAGTPTVIQAIKAEDKIVKTNSEYKQLQHLKIKTDAQAKAAIPKLNELKALLDRAASTVATASATPSQKAGQRDWVSGARDDATGVGDLSVALRDLVNGRKNAAEAAATKSEKLLKAANTIGDKGDKLLGLPSSD